MAVVVAGVLLGGCGPGDPPLAGVDLPVAEAPESVASETVALPFQVELPAGYWTEGDHSYRFVIDCPHLDTPVDTNEVGFRVTSLTPLWDGPVYLRVSGLSSGIMSPSDVVALHPDQQTIAVVSFLGLNPVTIDAATADCVGALHFDGVGTEVLRPGAPFRP